MSCVTPGSPLLFNNWKMDECLWTLETTQPNNECSTGTRTLSLILLGGTCPPTSTSQFSTQMARMRACQSAVSLNSKLVLMLSMPFRRPFSQVHHEQVSDLVDSTPVGHYSFLMAEAVVLLLLESYSILLGMLGTQLCSVSLIWSKNNGYVILGSTYVIPAWHPDHSQFAEAITEEPDAFVLIG